MKALALFSGGLDSSLAIKVILDQGIEVVALNFKTPFCLCDRSKGCGSAIKDMADQLAVELKTVYLDQEYLKIVKKPKYGYGKNLNPCIDCRIFKFKKAKEMMKGLGASFIITGEVLGQRPMSQYRQALVNIEKKSGLEKLILRPLSAKLFPPSLAEEKGWVDRNALLDISGRTRKPQIELAKKFSLKDYPCPAGGCLLTDPGFSKRLKNLMQYNNFTASDIEFLKIGRYFRINAGAYLTVGRNEKENNRLSAISRNQDIVFEPVDEPGPTAVGRGRFDQEIKTICSRIIARYTNKGQAIKVKIKSRVNENEESVVAESLNEDELKSLMIN